MYSSLYDQDLKIWLERTIQQLKNHDFDSLDIDHLIEELIDLGKTEKNLLKSNLMILLAHLLKLKIQHDVSDSMKASWYSSVLEHRQRVLNSLADTPSLTSVLENLVEQAYPNGRKLAIKEGKLAKFGIRIPHDSEYPSICPFTIAQILDDDFFPS